MAVNQLKIGAMLSFLTFGAVNALGLLYTPFMLRMMGQEEYGLYSLVASVVSYLTMLDFGFGNAIIRYTAQYRAEKREDELPQIFGMFTILYGVVGIVALLLGFVLFFNTHRLFGETMTDVELGKLRIMMGLLVFNVAFTFAMNVWHYIPVAYERFIFSKLLNLVRMLLNPIVMVLLLYMGYKAIALVVVITLFNVVTLCIDAWYCKMKLRIQIRFMRFRRDFMREVIFYSFWIFLGIIVERIYWSTGQFILGMYVGSGAVAVYAVAVQLAYVYMGLGSFLWSLLLPKVTTMVSQGNALAISDLFVRSCRIQYTILLFVLIVFIVFGKSFITLWAGEEYENVYPITLMFFVALLFPYAQNLGAVVSQARNSVKPYALIRLVTSGVGLIASVFLTQEYEEVGCAIGVLGALFIQTVALNIYYHRSLRIDIPRFWGEILKVSWLPMIVCVIGWYLLQNMKWGNLATLVLGIALFTALLMFSCWKVSLNNYERELIMQPANKLVKKLKRVRSKKIF